ncbi:MAG: hypothetical protein LBR57_02015 [Alistipes sp.]|jgi:hypothetical protein|nr:hypothetical protein [Alistipes sp.]
MKKTNFFKLLLVGAFSLSLGFVGCKDYGDEIKEIKENINLMKADLDKVRAQLNSMDWVKSVTMNEGKNELTLVYMKNGVEGTLTFTSPTPGSKITKSEDGFWVFDGEKTKYPVAGINIDLSNLVTETELADALKKYMTTEQLMAYFTGLNWAEVIGDDLDAAMEAAIAAAIKEALFDGETPKYTTPEEVTAAINAALATIVPPATVYPPRVNADGVWEFANEEGVYTASDYLATGASFTKVGDVYTLWMYNSETGEYESIVLPTQGGAAPAVALKSVEVWGVVKGFDPAEGQLYADTHLGDVTITVNYGQFTGYSNGTAGAGAEATGYVWGGSAAPAKNSVTNSLAAEGVGILVKVNQGAELTAANKFELVDTAGDNLNDFIGFGKPVLVSKAVKYTDPSTRAGVKGTLYFVPLGNPATLPTTADGKLAEEYVAMLNTDNVYSLVVDGVYTSLTPVEVAAGASNVASGMTADQEVTNFVLATKDSENKDKNEAIADGGVFATANSGKDYRLALKAEGAAVNIVDYYLEWNGVVNPNATIKVLDKFGAAPATRAEATPVPEKGKGFNITITGAVTSVNVQFDVYALGVDGKVYKDVLDVTAVPSTFPEVELTSKGNVEIVGTTAWDNETGKRLMPTITIPLDEMFTKMDATGFYAGTTKFSDFWKNAESGPTAVTLSVTAATGPQGAQAAQAGWNVDNIMKPAEGYKFVAKNAAGTAITDGKIYTATSLELTLPTSYGAEGATPTFPAAAIGKEHVITLSFTKGEQINKVTLKFTPKLPAVTITEVPYEFSAGYVVDGVLIGWLEAPAELASNGYVADVTYTLNRGAFSGPGATAAKFAITTPGAYFTAASADAPAVNAESTTPGALQASKFVEYNSATDVFTLKNQVPTISSLVDTDDVIAKGLAKNAFIADNGEVTLNETTNDVNWNGTGDPDATSVALTYNAANDVVKGISDTDLKAKAQTELNEAVATASWQEPYVTNAKAAALAQLQAAADGAEAARLALNAQWNAYGKELTMTPTMLSYLVAYNVNPSELAQYEYKVKILSPLDKTKANFVEASNGISVLVGQTVKIGKDQIWMTDRSNIRVDLFPVWADAASAYASKYIHHVEFFKPVSVGTGGYTLEGAVNGVVTVPAATDSAVSAVSLTADTQVTNDTAYDLGVKVYDIFGGVHTKTITVNVKTTVSR